MVQVGEVPPSVYLDGGGAVGKLPPGAAGDGYSIGCQILDVSADSTTVGKILKGAGKCIQVATAIYNMAKIAYEIAQAFIEENMVAIGLLVEQLLIQVVDFAISLVPIVGWIYAGINFFVSAITGWLAKHTDWLDEGFSLTEAIAMWCPSPYIAMSVKLEALNKVNDLITEKAKKEHEYNMTMCVPIYPAFSEQDDGKDYLEVVHDALYG